MARHSEIMGRKKEKKVEKEKVLTKSTEYHQIQLQFGVHGGNLKNFHCVKFMFGCLSAFEARQTHLDLISLSPENI